MIMDSFKNRIVYQIWPRSFKDSNGDGIGDLQGIISKLGYLKSLGIETLWLSPIYSTQNKDYGYDIDDYFKINPEFGTMADFDELIVKAKRLEIGIVMDLVANHTSDHHEWFQKALESKDSPYRGYYFFRKGRQDGKGNPLPPNNWLSAFGGSAWQKDEASDEYYLTLFTPNQCDLNWENENVRKGIYESMRFWLDKGIIGFRMDVINTISKTENLPSVGTKENLEFPFEHIVSLPRSHDYLKEMHKEVLLKYSGSLTVGEGSITFTVGEGMVTSKEDLNLYTNPKEKELNMMFQFDLHLLGCGPLGKYDFRKFYRWTIKEMKDTIDSWQLSTQEGGGWLGNFMSNHDQPRQVSRFGDDRNFRRKSAKALALLNMTLRGTPFLYQGEEIGMTNCHLEMNEWKDYEAINDYKVLQEMMHLPGPIAKKVIQKMTRDQARTPMQWTNAQHAGFSEVTPWMKVNPNYKWINVEDEEKRDQSLIGFYREIISLRKEYPSLSYGSYASLDKKNKKVIAYLREIEDQRMLVIVNLSKDKAQVDLSEIDPQDLSFVLGTYEKKDPERKLSLEPYEALVYRLAL